MVRRGDGVRVSWAILSFLRKENLINLIPKLIMNKVYYIGLDVHKDSIAIAYTNSESREEAIFYGTCGGGITTAERKLRKTNL